MTECSFNLWKTFLEFLEFSVISDCFFVTMHFEVSINARFGDNPKQSKKMPQITWMTTKRKRNTFIMCVFCVTNRVTSGQRTNEIELFPVEFKVYESVSNRWSSNFFFCLNLCRIFFKFAEEKYFFDYVKTIRKTK